MTLDNHMKRLELFLQPTTSIPRATFKSDLWEAMEKEYHQPSHGFLFRWRAAFFGGAIALSLGVVMTTQLVTSHQTTQHFNSLDSDLASMEQDITQDPVIAEALQLPQ